MKFHITVKKKELFPLLSEAQYCMPVEILVNQCPDSHSLHTLSALVPSPLCK